MEKQINGKQKKFAENYEVFVEKVLLSKRIVKRLTDAVFNDQALAEANIKTTEELDRFYKAVDINLNILIELYEHCNNKAADSLSQLVSIENDLTLFTYKPPNLNQYKPNDNGECMIVKIGNPSIGRCYMNVLNEPELQLSSICRENLMNFPESGEVFAVELEDRRLYRAVRSDLIFKKRAKIIVYLLDVGKRLEIPYSLKKFYSLPSGVQKLESRAIPCKVVEINDENGLSLDVGTNMQLLLIQPLSFEVVKLERNILWIKIWLKEINKNANETVVAQKDTEVSGFETLDAIEENRQQSGILRSAAEPESECTCDICRSTFPTKLEIEVHMNLHIRKLRAIKSKPETNKKLHIFQYCDKSFNLKGNLKRHLRVHTGEKPYACDICRKHFTQRSNLIRHKKVHTGEKPHKCNICGWAFIQKNDLLNHLETHKIICKFCNKVFPQIIDLKRHIKVHKDKTAFICDTCGKMFSSMLGFKGHLNLHTEAKTYPCKICGKSFLRMQSLQGHSQIHSRKKFVCRICEKTFFYKHVLDVHLRIHTGERPFSCKICKKTFAYSKVLKQHLISRAHKR